VLRFNHRELVDHKPVIRRRVQEIHQADPITGNRAICSAVLDLDTIPQHLVESTIVPDEGWGIEPQDFKILPSGARFHVVRPM